MLMNERDVIVFVLLLAAGTVALPFVFGLLVTPWSVSMGHWTMMPWMTGGTGWIGLLALLGLIGVGVFLVVMNTRTRSDDAALAILKTRYARGEITADECHATEMMRMTAGVR
jgi:uncharacterized membrane protein